MALTKIQKIGVAGGGMFFFSILFKTVILPAILNFQVKHEVALKTGWKMRELWGKYPFSFEFRFYMFNVTNPDEITNGEKPIVQEVGPFIYEEWQEKTNQMDHDEDDTVSYTARSTFFFNAEKSGALTGDEEIIVPNYFILGLLATIMKEKPSVLPIAGKAIDSIFKKPKTIFMKAKVRDILFDGLIIDCTVKDFAGSAVCSEIAAAYQDLGLQLLSENVYSMSLWGPMNGTDEKARTRVNRGIKNFMNLGTVVEYNNKPNVSVWNDEYCDKFNGTDGTIFHPFFDKKGREDIVAFKGALCRSLSLHYDSKSKWAGIKTLRYTGDLGIDPVNNPRHKCYCDAPDSCLKPGAYDAYNCIKAPIIVTNPHFYMADPYYLSTVDGLKPDREQHMLIIDFNTFTGAPLHAHTRAQFNMFITKIDKFKLMKKFPDALLPLLWFDQILVLPDFLLKDIKNGLIMYKLGLIYQYFMMFGGLGLCAFAGYKQYRSMNNVESVRNGKKTEPSKDGSNSVESVKTINMLMENNTSQTKALPNVE